MAQGSVPRLPFPVTGLVPQPDYSMPAAEERLMQFDDINLWIQPDLGNPRRTGKHLRIPGRNGYHAYSSDDAIVVAPGMAGNVPVITFPGGITTAPELPMHVPGYFITGDYFVCMLIRWAAGASLNGTAYQLYHAGIDGGDDVELYMLNNAIYQRHGAAQNASTGSKFALDTSALVWASYDEANNIGEVGINSASPVSWQSTAITAPGGEGRPLVIGGKLNTGATAGTQMFHGAVRSVWASNTKHWCGEENAQLREAFLGEIASMYPLDITLT